MDFSPRKNENTKFSLAKIAKHAKKIPKTPFPEISFAISAILAREKFKSFTCSENTQNRRKGAGK
jgi:hypothetical protein